MSSRNFARAHRIILPFQLTSIHRAQGNPSRIITKVAYSVTLIPGDGIGPEVADAAVRAVDATGVSIKWQRVELTSNIIQNSGQILPGYVLDSLQETRVGLKGPVT